MVASILQSPSLNGRKSTRPGGRKCDKSHFCRLAALRWERLTAATTGLRSNRDTQLAYGQTLTGILGARGGRRKFHQVNLTVEIVVGRRKSIPRLLLLH